MKVTRKHQIYSGIVIAGLCAVVGDRVFNSPAPAETAGAMELLVLPTTPAPAVAPAPKAPASPVDPLVSDNLLAVANSHPFDLTTTRDAFSTTAGWKSTPVEKIQNDENDAAFVQKHKLMSTVVRAKTPEALIDNHLLHLGDELDGYRLISITNRSAVFDSGTSKIELRFKLDQ